MSDASSKAEMKARKLAGKVDARTDRLEQRTEAKRVLAEADAARDARTGKLLRRQIGIVYSLYVFEHEVWMGLPDRRGSVGGSLVGVKAEVIVNGQITQRLTATRMSFLGPFALAVPKKGGNQSLSIRVGSPTFTFTYHHRRDISRWSIATFDRFADLINTLASSHVGAASTYPIPTLPIADELAKLAALHDQGVLTDEEFQTSKARLLA